MMNVPTVLAKILSPSWTNFFIRVLIHDQPFHLEQHYPLPKINHLSPVRGQRLYCEVCWRFASGRDPSSMKLKVKSELAPFDVDVQSRDFRRQVHVYRRLNGARPLDIHQFNAC